MKSVRILQRYRAGSRTLSYVAVGVLSTIPMVTTTNSPAQEAPTSKSAPADAATQPEQKPASQPQLEQKPAAESAPTQTRPGEAAPAPGGAGSPEGNGEGSAAHEKQPDTVAEHEAAAKEQATQAEGCLATAGACTLPFNAGKVYHPFNKNYWLLGLNYQKPNSGGIFEIEASYVPWISDELSWFGFWGSGGIVTVGTAPTSGDVDDNEPYGRGGMGVELGWRFLAADFGMLAAWTPDDHDHGLDVVYRVRGGLALAQDLSSPKEDTTCCPESSSPSAARVNCECSRTPHGVSLFVYYSREYAPDRDARDPAPFARSESMFGLSLKYGFGRGSD